MSGSKNAGRGVRLALWLLRRHPRRFRERFGREVEADLNRATESGAPSSGLVRDAVATLARSWRDEVSRRLSDGGPVDDSSGRVGLASAGGALAGEAKHALRGLIRDPVHGVVTVLTLALAIGANAAVFSVAWSVLLRTLPYEAPERTVLVEPPPVALTGAGGFSVTETLSGLPRIESAAAFTPGGSANLSGAAGAEPVRVTHVADGFFDVLGARLALGRAVSGGDSGPEAVLSYGLWQRAYGGDSGVIGRTIRLSDHAVTVTGVAAPEVVFPSNTDVWLSYPVLFDLMGSASGGEVIARVESATIIAELRAAYEARLRAQWSADGREFPDDAHARLTPLRSSLVGAAGDSLVLLLGASALVLLLGCVNLAGLALARNAARRGEFVMRRALGAGRFRLVRMVFVESLVVALIAGVLSVAFVSWGRALLVRLLPAGLPGLTAGGAGAETFAFVAALVLAASLLIGLVPAFQLWFDDPALPGAAGRIGSRRRRAHPVLVVAQVAVAVVLVVSAALLGRSVLALRLVPLGFDTENVYTFETRLPWADDWDEAAFLGFADGVRDWLMASPGVRLVGVSSRVPLSDGLGVGYRVWPDGGDEAAAISGSVTDASPSYFDAMGIRFRAGGSFASDASAAGTVVLSRRLAESLYGDASVAGRQVRVRTSMRSDPAAYTIVGVVDDVRANGFLVEPRPSLYFPFRQKPVPGMAFAVRVSGNADDVAGLIRRAVSEVDPSVAPFAVRSMRSAAGEAIAARDALALVSGLFGVAAMALAALGIYGLVSQGVVRRRREMGVRLALGARGGDLLRLVLGGTAALAAAGILIGLTASFGATRLLAGFLFGVGATDPVTFAAVSGLVLIAAIAAAMGPARRAAGTDPMTSLRQD